VLRSFRIVKLRHAATAFDGEGARRHGGRWNSRGTRMVYTAESRALALLEILTHTGNADLFAAYAVIDLVFDAALVVALKDADLPAGWRASPPPAAMQTLGDRWAADRTSVVLRVPSVLVPEEFNYLLNPAHPDFNQLRIGRPEPLAVDARLARR
jgi:RES domain-containing protein